MLYPFARYIPLRETGRERLVEFSSQSKKKKRGWKTINLAIKITSKYEMKVSERRRERLDHLIKSTKKSEMSRVRERMNFLIKFVTKSEMSKRGREMPVSNF